MRSDLCHPVKEKGLRVYEMVVSSAVQHIFRVTAMHAKATASSRLERANRASHGPRVRAKEFFLEKGKGILEETPMVPKVRARVKPRRLVYHVLKT